VPVFFRENWFYIAGAVVLIGFCFFPVKLYLRFYRFPGRFIVNSRFVFWFIPLEVNLVNPVTKMFWNLSQNRPWREKAPADLPARRIRWPRVLRRARQAGRIAAKVWRGANRLFIIMGKRITVKELNLYTEIGLANPAHTALSAGLIWSLLGVIYSRMSAFFNMRSTGSNFKVVPNYRGDNLLVVDYSCIFEFRMGHIIIIIIYQVIKNGAEIYTLIRRISK
jgi:energy-coupling factor transporter transmembrane protein EcfT